MTFIEKLDFLLEKNGLNKTDFSRQSEIPYRTITSWYKKGSSQIPRNRLVEIAKFFKVTLDFICDDDIDCSEYEKHCTTNPKVFQAFNSLNDHRKIQAQEYIDFLHHQQVQFGKEEIANEIFPINQDPTQPKLVAESIEKNINIVDDLK